MTKIKAMTPELERKDVIARNLAVVRDRIARATKAAHRSDEPELIVVTKFHPAQDALLLCELGEYQLGESRDQEAEVKAREVAAELTTTTEPTWHFIGQLQSKKSKSVVQYASVVHSVDRIKLVTALSVAKQDQPGAIQGPLHCFVQVNLAEESSGAEGALSRGGVAPQELLELADHVAEAPGLELLGVMMVAPLGGDAEAAFDQLASVSERLQRQHPGANRISAGMSQDLEMAIKYGATHLRIGTDVLGYRPKVR